MHDEYLKRGGAARFLWEAKRSRGKIRLTEGDLASLPTPPLVRAGLVHHGLTRHHHFHPFPAARIHPPPRRRSVRPPFRPSKRMRQKTNHESSQKAQEPHVRHRPSLKYRKTCWRRHFSQVATPWTTKTIANGPGTCNPSVCRFVGGTVSLGWTSFIQGCVLLHRVFILELNPHPQMN